MKSVGGLDKNFHSWKQMCYTLSFKPPMFSPHGLWGPLQTAELAPKEWSFHCSILPVLSFPWWPHYWKCATVTYKWSCSLSKLNSIFSPALFFLPNIIRSHFAFVKKKRKKRSLASVTTPRLAMWHEWKPKWLIHNLWALRQLNCP